MRTNKDGVLLGEQESKGALDAIAKGTSRLPRLGPYEDTDVYPIADANGIDKQGFLHLQPSSQNCFVSFAVINGGGGFMKRQTISMGEVEALLNRFPFSEAERMQLLGDLKQGRTTSMLTKVSLKTLYDSGLV